MSYTVRINHPPYSDVDGPHPGQHVAEGPIKIRSGSETAIDTALESVIVNEELRRQVRSMISLCISIPVSNHVQEVSANGQSYGKWQVFVDDDSQQSAGSRRGPGWS